jgi:hypothetical protein
MLPEPVETESSTRPFTVMLRSNVASEASAGTVATARAAAAIQTNFIVFLIPNAVVSDQLSIASYRFFPQRNSCGYCFLLHPGDQSWIRAKSNGFLNFRGSICLPAELQVSDPERECAQTNSRK